MVSLYLAQWNNLTPMTVPGAVCLPCTAGAAGLVSLLSWASYSGKGTLCMHVNSQGHVVWGVLCAVGLHTTCTTKDCVGSEERAVGMCTCR